MWNREPSVIIGAIASAIALLVAFGVHVTDEQAKAVLGAATALLPLIACIAVRSQVSPVVKPPSVPPLPILLILLALLSCSAAQKKTEIAAVDFACIVAEDELGVSEPAAIALFCALPIDVVINALATQRAARAMARGDAGK